MGDHLGLLTTVGLKKRWGYGLHGWMASLTRWMRVWVNSGSWWWTGRPGVLRFLGLQRVRHNWATELNWTCAKALRYFVLLERESGCLFKNQCLELYYNSCDGHQLKQHWFPVIKDLTSNLKSFLHCIYIIFTINFLYWFCYAQMDSCFPVYMTSKQYKT